VLFIFVLEDNFAILCNENIDASALASSFRILHIAEL